MRVLGAVVLGATLMALLAGCASIGAQRLPIDREDYAQHLRQSEKEQMLANIVALHLGDPPIFLSVTSVISQYSREATGHLNFEISRPPDDPQGDTGASMTFRESPTVTYTPLSGERLAQTLLAPMSPQVIMTMIEGGWSAADLFTLAVRGVNGVRNTSRAALFAEAADPRFAEVAAALGRLQRSGALSMRLVGSDKAFTASAWVRADPSAQDRADLDFLRQTLKAGLAAGNVRIVFASEAQHPGELAIVTRSLFEILQEMSEGVDADGLIRIHSGPSRPAQAHVAVQRDGRWYWIDAGDQRSKRMFLLAEVLLSLADDSGAARAPLVTLPAS